MASVTAPELEFLLAKWAAHLSFSTVAELCALVRRVDKKPKRRLRNVLESQGILPRQQITFLSDGGDTVRELPAFLHPRSEHILDWFHIGMRIEQLMHTARGLRGTATSITKELILKELGRVKWFLWHGNVVRADDTLSSLIDEVDGVRVSRPGSSNRRPSAYCEALRDETAEAMDASRCTLTTAGAGARPQ